ncbi:RtcB family protein [Anditalea andensis]|uniref:3'-phosphate/5'-hydroxy nucleic acid ligase n=1 Tax=Anditalea andensis TaxID=1048983 RepID=A0A074KSN2_9BACT|nr:RtcB family protein [Anditalea andensis]KEO72976.1 RtcB protein [Anditalea andensis]
MENLTIFGRAIIDDNAIRQIKNCIREHDIGVLTADAHYGYSHPIGGAVAYKDKISVSGVGFDIACGNKAVKTDICVDDIRKDLPHILDEIFRRISFGVGRPNNEPADHEVLDRIAKAEFIPQRKMLKMAKEQLGTVGSGNHYVDLFEGEDGLLWIGVHFGSRGFGHKTATGFIAMSQGLDFTDRGKEGAMDSPPILLDIHSDLGQSYIQAMNLAGAYAYAGRDMVVAKVIEILGNPKVAFEVHNHHNFAWTEKHFGEDYWVVRKGCTPAFPGQQGFIGANMLDASVVIEGVEGHLSQKALYSTVHGAGRVMSRTEAAGKKKWIRDKKNGKKVPTIVARGKVDFDAVKLLMKGKNIELRGAGADEAPEVYKKLQEVMAHMGGTVEVLHTLNPIGVAMAGGDIYDPYKD